ncbi:MAG TPA: hypothetical protein VF411_03915 [Bacteroidia bacterium]
MKKHFLVILLIFSSCFSFVQKTDSLLTLLKTAKEDTNKVSLLNELGWQLLNNANYDSALLITTHHLKPSTFILHIFINAALCGFI